MSFELNILSHLSLKQRILIVDCPIRVHE